VQCFKEFAEVIAENKGKQPQVLWSHPAMPFDWRAERAIAKLSDGAWSQLIKHFATWPDEMRTLNPRKFEEFIAELFRCSGGDIVLTPRTRDGGRDILLRVVKPSGEWYYLVECKRYCQSRPVNVSLVRALYGVVEAEKATGGIIVTTSSFTKDALKFRESIKYRMSLKDFADIKRWVQRVRGSKSRRTAFNEAMIALS
jgi:HJR/Mrr/RecB family endonuclease